VVVDRAQAKAARRQAFGFNLSALSIFDRAMAKDEANSLTSTAAEAYRDNDGKWIIVLDDGARWRQIDDEVLSEPPHQGSAIRIRHASLGSFVMNIDGQPYIRVHRDQ
jgi:predicted extracellular nuclease